MGRTLRPRSIADALAALAEGPWRVVAGGTDHFPARVIEPGDEDILDITALPDLRAIERRAIDQRAGDVRVGDARAGERTAHDVWLPALATWTDVREAGLPPAFDGLVAASGQIGGPQIQNFGTVVGNVCNASPAADGVPCLLALEAEVVLACATGRRSIPLAEFVLGPRRTARRPDELVLGLRIPEDGAPSRATFEKLGARRYMVISIAMVAAVVGLEADGRTVARAAIAVGACGPCATRLPALEAALIGRVPEPALVRPEHLAGLSPIDDIRASAVYRLDAALELVRRAVAGLAAPRARAA